MSTLDRYAPAYPVRMIGPVTQQRCLRDRYLTGNGTPL
jgi:hypothetical protein